MNPLLYVKLGAIAFALFGSAYLGYSFEHSRFVAFKAAITEETRLAEKQHQDQANEIRKIKDAQIRTINNQLADALVQLRNRTSRSQATSDGQSGTGATLFAEDAEFLVREAARADQIRVGLEACYKQYDAL